MKRWAHKFIFQPIWSVSRTTYHLKGPCRQWLSTKLILHVLRSEFRSCLDVHIWQQEWNPCSHVSMPWWCLSSTGQLNVNGTIHGSWSHQFIFLQCQTVVLGPHFHSLCQLLQLKMWEFVSLKLIFLISLCISKKLNELLHIY